MHQEDVYAPPKADLLQLQDQPGELALNRLASRWARLGASIIDALVMMVFFVGLLFFGIGFSVESLLGGVSIYQEILLTLTGLAIYLIFNAYLLHKNGQTIGKWVLGIKIVGVATGKILPLWKVFLIRYLPQIFVAQLPIIGQFLIFIESLFIFRADKRCVHDLIAGTVVIKQHAG